jgi:hypothetical protein
VVDKILPQLWLHNTEFGKFKLEHKIQEGFFIAPKLYYLECLDKDNNVYTVSKCRGFNGSLNRQQILTLFNGGSINLKTQKWFRDWDIHGVYFNLDSNLHIAAPFNKRIKIFDENNRWVDTKPLTLNHEIVKPLTLSPIEFNIQDQNTEAFWRIHNVLDWRNNPNFKIRNPVTKKSKKK